MSNLPEGVFRFEKVKFGQAPDWATAVRISTHLTISEAMEAADALRRGDNGHTYGVADAAALN